MKVLVTGGAGFIGSHLCEHYLGAGCEVVCLDNLSTGSMENIEHLLGGDDFKFVKTDVSEYIHVSGPVNTILMAGAGLPSGQIYGATDEQGAYPTAGKFGPADLIATILHSLGVDHEQEVITALGRPYQLCEGQPVLDLWR